MSLSLKRKRKKKGASTRVDLQERSKGEEEVERKMEMVEEEAETMEKEFETVEKEAEMVEKEVETVVLSSSDGPDDEEEGEVSPPGALHSSLSIGYEEEMYLANKWEDLYEVVMTRETFDQEIKKMGSGEIFELMRSLIEYGQERAVTTALQLYKGEKEGKEKRPYVGTELCQNMKVINFQQIRMEWIYYEIRRRFVDERNARKAKAEEVKVLKEEIRTHQRSLEVLTRERSELQSGRASRSVAVERQDASVSTEAEGPGLERAGDLERPSPVEVSRESWGALETRIEEKVAKALSHFEERVTETLPFRGREE